MYDIATPAVITALVGFAVLVVVGLVALVAGGVQLTGLLRSERRDRVARHESIPTHYLRLARSH